MVFNVLLCRFLVAFMYLTASMFTEICHTVIERIEIYAPSIGAQQSTD